MTPERQRIAIAEELGWQIRPYGDMLVWYDPQGVARPIERGARNDCLPEFLNDLNAMHEAEKTLDIDQQYDYGIKLQYLVLDEHAVEQDPLNGWGYFALAHATASQRAEAFLRTLNLWEEQ